MSHLPVVIVGAPRSGTNMLRDALTRCAGLETWPCDEINYIWRHGNVRYPSDELPAELARDTVRRYVRRQFGWVERRYRARAVVEKTCANSLRVDFVDRVVPEARFVFIRRNGLDATASAVQRWRAGMEWAYVLRKARFVPRTDLPYYAVRYLGNRAYRMLSGKRRLAFWGPRLDGMDEILARHPLEEVCALQWKRCVDAAAESLERRAGERWLEVGYEDFVSEPVAGLRRVLDFLGVEADDAEVVSAVAGVSAGSVGRGRTFLGQELVERVMALIGDTMGRYGYR